MHTAKRNPDASDPANRTTSAVGSRSTRATAGPEDTRVTEPVVISAPPNGGLRPVGALERIDEIDILRGLAILGILFVNIHDFSFPSGFGRFYPEMFGGALDQFVRRSLQFLIETKFYSMFSFLFGLGAAVQMTRAEKRGEPFAPRYRRRLLVLLAIGLVHDVFLWTGGILIAYATLGFLIIPFRRRRPKTLLWWVAGLLVVPLLVISIATPIVMSLSDDPAATEEHAAVEEPGATEDATPGAGAEPDADADEDAERRQELAEAIALFQSSRYLDQVAYRVRELPRMLMAIVALSPYILAMFLMGVWTWRRGIFQKLEDHLPLVRRILLWALAPGLLGNILLAWIRVAYSGQPPAPVIVVGAASHLIGLPALCIAYIAAAVLLARTPGGRRVLSPLAPVGRTALSNYLLQTVVCTTIFYGYALGWFATTGPTVNLVLTVAILAGQVVLSAWWVRRFRFGPAEWLWRSLTYRRLQPMRIAATPRAPAALR